MKAKRRGDADGFLKQGACPAAEIIPAAGEKNHFPPSPAGDKKAFEELLRGYLKILYHYIYTRVREPENIDDIIQETLLSAWQSIGAYKAASSFKTWLLAIANHKINDFFRNRYRRQTETLDENAEIPGERDFTLRVAEKSDVQKALAVLSEDEKRLVHLIFNVGLGYGEISRLMNIPEGTIKSRMFAIKAKLKKTLGGQYYG